MKDLKEHIVDVAFSMNSLEHWFTFGFKWACMQLLENGFDEDCAEELNAALYTMAKIKEERILKKAKKAKDDR